MLWGWKQRGAAWLWVSELLFLSCTESSSLLRWSSPRIVSFPQGEKQFQFDTHENHVLLYHEEGTPTVFVGAANKLYIYDFETSTSHTEPFDIVEGEMNCGQENYLTLLREYEDKLLICGTNDCNPACWYWVNGAKERRLSAQGLAPYELDLNFIVLVDGSEIYSTIKKHRYGKGRYRFRRIEGAVKLYSSFTLMNNPQFVKGAILKQDEPHNERIYLFFREDNPEWPRNPTAPRTVSRVAQLCKSDNGGPGSISASMWTTFLKATLLCADNVTDRHFDNLQDLFIVESPIWSETKVYGVFSNEWNYSAVCVYTVDSITKIFQTSPFKGYNGEIPTVRPGQCLEGNKATPTASFSVADSYPEMSEKVKQHAVFYSKHFYHQIGVHQVQVADEETYSVLYLSTDRGTIHKVVLLPKGAMNILEIQPFRSSATIKSMTLDNARNELFVASGDEVVQLPMDMCGAYKDNCESCVLARDPHCGWIDGTCASVYDHDQYGNRKLLQALTHDVPSDICSSAHYSNTEGKDTIPHDIPLLPQARYYLNCSAKSHHADYTWFHNDQNVTHCSSGHHHCIHFIKNMTDDLYGNYFCISQEGWFREILMTENLVKPTPETMLFRSSLPTDWAIKASLSSWLNLLNMVLVVLIIW
ncbi:semaphorin-7A [Sceloporus undulatus]|uniref:semaphorin-7A n=1 Tax=Sceloporus undulatus TaxID=8520 RepID=UPI001C4C69F9|nr:semaphorin-7A [Sceloporus undulatus]